MAMAVIQDYKTAVKCYKLAADQGYSPAQFGLAISYFAGRGTVQDFTRAHMWFNLAAAQDADLSVEAARERDKLAKEMTPEDISKAQDMARECVAKNYKGC